jgi:hypothetical protein
VDPAWAAVIVAVLALIISAVSAAFSWKSLLRERLSAESAGRSAEAAERANRLTERAVELGALPPRAAGNDGLHEARADVHWRIEHAQGNRYVLRNVGTDTAEHVEVDHEQLPPIHRNLPRDAVVRPGEGVDMLMMGAMGRPMPNQLYLRWEGQSDWVAVPLV